MKLYCCWEIMDDEQRLGIITDDLDIAKDFKRQNPQFDSIYKVILNEPTPEIWGEFVE